MGEKKAIDKEQCQVHGLLPDQNWSCKHGIISTHNIGHVSQTGWSKPHSFSCKLGSFNLKFGVAMKKVISVRKIFFVFDRFHCQKLGQYFHPFGPRGDYFSCHKWRGECWLNNVSWGIQCCWTIWSTWPGMTSICLCGVYWINSSCWTSLLIPSGFPVNLHWYQAIAGHLQGLHVVKVKAPAVWIAFIIQCYVKSRSWSYPWRIPTVEILT